VTDPAFQGLAVFERGWLSSNNVLVHDDEAGALLIDTGHCVHAGQTIDLLRRALGGRPLARVVNTHLHSDHCGGNAAIERAFGVSAHVPRGSWEAASRWDEDALSYRATRQLCERFSPCAAITPGEVLQAGGRRFEVIAAPGHDPESVMLFDARHGLLVSADALWENGFGVVFPELEGESAFDDVAAVLDLIERLPVQWVVPGHGAPFSDAAAALQRARARLAALRADPARHARHAVKVLIKYHLMEVREQPLAELLAWCASTPLLLAVHARQQARESPHDWSRRFVDELVQGGALAFDGLVVRDAA
jgi:glyoxylase-like metal-dependent hydrolase (beta-lactamase superfamily II)